MGLAALPTESSVDEAVHVFRQGHVQARRFVRLRAHDAGRATAALPSHGGATAALPSRGVAGRRRLEREEAVPLLRGGPLLQGRVVRVLARGVPSAGRAGRAAAAGAARRPPRARAAARAARADLQPRRRVRRDGGTHHDRAVAQLRSSTRPRASC